MAKISLSKLIPGKKYKMIVEADNEYFLSDVFSAIDFTVPKAPIHAKLEKLDIKKTTYNAKVNGKTIKKPRLLLNIPSSIMSGLIWNDSVRDIVYIVYRTAADKNAALATSRKYLNGATLDFSSIPTIPSWTNGQVKTFAINVKDSNYYSFQFLIARYIKDSSGNWDTKFWLQGNKLNDVLSQQSGWGS